MPWFEAINSGYGLIENTLMDLLIGVILGKQPPWKRIIILSFDIANLSAATNTDSWASACTTNDQYASCLEVPPMALCR